MLDKQLRVISVPKWMNYIIDPSYCILKTSRIGEYFIIAKWIDIDSCPFLIETYNIHEESIEEILHCFTEEATMALYKDRIAAMISKNPDHKLQLNKEVCILCGAPMVGKMGKHGPFFSCSTWAETGCICTCNEHGQLSKKTIDALKPKEAKQQKAKNKKPSNTKTYVSTIIDSIELE